MNVNNSVRKKDTNSSNEEKIKEKFLEFYEINKKLDKLNFIELYHLYPFKNVQEILILSNSDVGKIKNEISNVGNSMTEILKNSLLIVFEIFALQIVSFRLEARVKKFFFF